MGVSPTPRIADGTERVAVAFSGGRDSTALLHATCRALRGTAVEVVALHVHHGLVDDADEWVRHAGRLCARWRRSGYRVRVRASKLAGSPARGESIEAWARRERYAALGAMAHSEGVSLVLLAHHRRDQAETVLLQALRGAGPAGLAAMPRVVVRAGLTWARPWLQMPRRAIDAYLARHRLHSVEDPSNIDTRYARNRLRLEVWPALDAAFPHAEAAFASLALRAAYVAATLDEVATSDLAVCADQSGLDIAQWSKLSPPRRQNALHHWCRRALGRAVPGTLIARLCAELPERYSGQWPAPGAVLRLYRGRLRTESASAVERSARAPVDIDLSCPGNYSVPTWNGSWRVASCPSGGLAKSDLCHAQLRPRLGGEKLALPPSGAPRSLKKQFQSAGVAAAVRDAPLVWADERLLFVPGLGADARAIAASGVPQCCLQWVPHPEGAAADNI